MKNINVAVVGVGRLGGEHARVYSRMDGAALFGVVDIDSRRGNEISREYGVPLFSDYRELEGKIDAVSIVVPTDMHYETASFFLSRGVHVLLEKPMTETLEQADSLIDISEKNNALLQVGHVERFNSALSEASSYIQKPRFIECHRLAPYQPRGTEVSVVLDLMIHDIDIIVDLVKSGVESIDALGVNVLSSDVDIANARIKFENGTVANVTSSRVSREKLRKIRIFGHNRYVSINYLDQSVTMCKKEDGGIVVEQVEVDREEPLKLELEHFVRCVSEGQRPLVCGKSAREALRLALEVSDIIGKSV